MRFFGDIFRYQESEYVFLGGNGELIYAVKILPPHQSKMIKELDDKRTQRPTSQLKTNENVLYYYVTLTTPNFEDRAAHLNTPDQDADRDILFDWLNISLNETDKLALKNEILRTGSPVSMGLRKIVEHLEL